MSMFCDAGHGVQRTNEQDAGADQRTQGPARQHGSGTRAGEESTGGEVSCEHQIRFMC